MLVSTIAATSLVDGTDVYLLHAKKQGLGLLRSTYSINSTTKSARRQLSSSPAASRHRALYRATGVPGPAQSSIPGSAARCKAVYLVAARTHRNHPCAATESTLTVPEVCCLIADARHRRLPPPRRAGFCTVGSSPKPPCRSS
jgi:hypothetical protein